MGLQIPLAKIYGGIGCAIGISIALVVGQIIAMNIYYYKRQGIDIPKFWKEIAKMSLTPIILGVISYLLIMNITLDSVPKLCLGIILFSVVYMPVFWFIGMNKYERDLLSTPLKKQYLKLISR